MRKVLILLSTAILIVLLAQHYINIHEDIIHLRGNEFKKKPEASIEATILHREKEVYNHVFSSYN